MYTAPKSTHESWRITIPAMVPLQNAKYAIVGHTSNPVSTKNWLLMAEFCASMSLALSETVPADKA